MKLLFVTILLFAHYQAAWAQTDPGHQLLQTDSKVHCHYVDLQDSVAWVYTIGYLWRHGSSGLAITSTDTLQKQPDSSYRGRSFQIVLENDRLYLLSMSGKNRKFRLSAANDTNFVNYRLNEAWLRGSYFMMYKRLNQRYPLNYIDDRDAYATWYALSDNEKSMPYLQFRGLVDKRIKEMSDSISVVQEKYVRLTEDILQNFRSWDYAALKDSIAQLPAVYMYWGTYCGVVVDTVALQRPEYFFRLAEDLPKHRSVILSYGAYNKHVFSGLMKVEGHHETKRALLKERRANRLSAYYAVGMTAVSVGLVALLAIAIF